MSDIYIDITDECSFTPSHGTELYDNTLLKVLYTDPETSKNYTISKNINVYPREEFNKPYKMSPLINNCVNMFNMCINFNQPITIGSNVEDCDNMFRGCYSFNSDVRIGKNVTYCENMFCVCNNFNANVVIGIDPEYKDTRVFTNRMFYYCENLNKSINFSDGVRYDHYETFYHCENLNSPIHLGYGIRGMDGTFSECYNFNSPITFSWEDNTAWDFSRSFNSIFYSCYNYNYPVDLPTRIVESSYTLSRCNNFNSYVSFTSPISTIKKMVGFFNGCTNYNYADIDLSRFPILNNLSNFLQGCNNFNKNVYLNWDSIEDISHILSWANSFNCFESLKSGLASATKLKSCGWAFQKCPMNFGNAFENIVISDSVENCAAMFHSCSNIYSSADFVFGNNVNNLCATFQNTNMIGDIYIYQNNSCNVYSMLFNCPNQYTVNVHCHNLAIINKTSASDSITGYPMTWTYESPGTYYNSAYGIRITNQF